MNHRIRLLAAIVVVSTSAPQSLAAQGVEAVLDKAELALGGAAVLSDVQSVRIRSHGIWELPSRGVPPTSFKAELVFSPPDRVRTSWEFPAEVGGNFTFGYDGEDAWGIWGAPRARCQGWLREVVRQMAAQIQLFFVAPARSEHRGAFALDAPATSENSALVKVSYRPIATSNPW